MKTKSVYPIKFPVKYFLKGFTLIYSQFERGNDLVVAESSRSRFFIFNGFCVKATENIEKSIRHFCSGNF